ncbi:MAG: CHAT domain-containing protein [Pyrinomonadaceae bacterium]|nr:CHAT domain-containing protein [Pyrinomonadaceae bacterium]
MLTGTALLKILKTLFLLSFFVTLPTICFTSNIYAATPNETEIKQIEDEAGQLASVWNENSYRRAFTLFQKSARSWRENGNYRKYAECLREAARLSMSLNEPSEAWEILNEALLAERKAGNVGGESETLSALTLIALWKKDLKSAEKLQKEAVSSSEISKQPAAIAKAAFASAEFFYRNQRNLPLMNSLQEKSLQFFREADDLSGQSQTLTMLAYTAVMNNDRAKGQVYAAEAIELARKNNNQRDLAFALIASGDARQRMGNWEESFEAFKEAESIYPENLDHTEKAILYVRFGFHFEAFGDLIQARSYFQKARELFIKSGNLYGNSELATRVGQISLQLGEKNQALANFNEGLEIGLQANDKYSMAYAFENIGELYFADGNQQNALTYYQKALINFNTIGIKHAVASVKEKIGKLYLQQNNFRNAERFFNEALQVHREISSKNGQASSFYNLAKMYQAEQNYEAGLQNIENCLKLTDNIQNQTANRKLRQSFMADIFDRHELYIELLMHKHRQFNDRNYALSALQAAEKSRARAFLENLYFAEADFFKDADADTVKRENEIRVLLNEKADILTDLLSQNAAANETEKISGEINELENEIEEIKAKLKQQSPLYSAIKNPAPFDISEFQQNILDEDSILLEFSFGKNESYLWLIEKDSFSSYVLPPRREMEIHIGKLRELLNSREMKKDETLEDFQKRSQEAEILYQTESRTLSDQLLGQIADKIARKRLIVIPDGNLHYFPLSALPFPNSSSDEPLLTTNETVYAPSAQTLLTLEKSRRAYETPKNLLIFSDPIFTAGDARFPAFARVPDSNIETAQKENFRYVRSLNSLQRLRGSKTESDSILEIVGSSKTDSFSGFDASREQLLKTNVGNYKIIHFATHGLTDENRPELSGIVLSRFDEKGQKRDEFFRMHDIYGLTLNADLVVLSACETGVGKEVKGDGLMSLNNAFLQTGAKTVMASLWKVEDTATLELMKSFYAGIANENLTPSQSLRQAQLKLRQNPQYKSPFIWAAFTVNGDFRNIPKISGNFGSSNYVLAFIPLMLVGFYLFRKRKLFFRRSR